MRSLCVCVCCMTNIRTHGTCTLSVLCPASQSPDMQWASSLCQHPVDLTLRDQADLPL